jgi:hypothetical protein
VKLVAEVMTACRGVKTFLGRSEGEMSAGWIFFLMIAASGPIYLILKLVLTLGVTLRGPLLLLLICGLDRLTQTEAAALLQVDGRTVRRLLEGTRPTPNVVIGHFHGLVDALDQTAQAITLKMGVPGLLLVYRQDRDVPRGPV